MRPFDLRFILAAGVLGCALNLPTAVAEPPSPDPAPVGGDSIFLGMQLYVNLGEEQLPLIAYKDRRHIVEIDGERVALSPPVDFTFKKEIRHSDRFIQMFDFESVPYSSEVADQLSRYAATTSQRNTQAAQLDQAIAAQANLISFADDVPDSSGMEQDYLQAQAEMGSVISQQMADLRGTDEALADIQRRLGEEGPVENFDALIVALKVRPDTDLKDCYLFARATYFDPASNTPNEPLYRIQFVEIGDLEAGKTYPKRFRISGFPPGPQVTQVSYHLYSRGKEIPTDYSEQRIELSEGEAYDFLYADMFADTHPKDSDPRLFKPLSLSDAPPVVSPAVLQAATVRFELKGSGELENLSLVDCPPDAKPAILAWLEPLRFLPALEGGVPVDRSVSVPLSQVVAR